MFKNWGAWLGVETDNGQAPSQDSAQVSDAAQKSPEPPQGFSGYFFSFASTASKKLSESVAETALTLKQRVEQEKIHGILDKTLLGDFQKEQQKFIQEKKAKKSSAAVPPWVGYDDEDTIQQQILALSADKRHFLRDPPAGVQFHFDVEHMYPVAMVMLEEDELLRKMRFHLVPKQVKEEVFWKNYFYRVSLIKQSAQLTALAAQQAAERREEKRGSSHEHPHQKDVIEWKTPPTISSSKIKSSEAEEVMSASPPVSEFVSDAFDSCKINEDDLHREIEQLVLDNQELPKETADWERELQQELQEYDVLADNENHDDFWEREIEEMLKTNS